MSHNLDRMKQRFIDGELTELSLGAYGSTVRVIQRGDRVTMKVTTPRQKQKSLSPNCRSVRKLAIVTAEVIVSRKQRLPSKRTPKVSSPRMGAAGVLTPKDIWLSYLSMRVPGIPDNVFTWGRRKVSAHIAALPPGARERSFSTHYMYSVICAARRLDRDGAVPLYADVSDIQPGDLDRWITKTLASAPQDSSWTAKTYIRRFQSAVRFFRRKWPHQWGDRRDPTEGVTQVTTRHIKPQEITEERAAAILARLRRQGAWRTFAAAMIAHESGRRIGAIAGWYQGMHLDAPPLCASDFRKDPTGQLEVIWRADAQKGKGYGRKDEGHPATRRLRLVFRWLRRFHPNPLGPDHPIIWDADDPTRAEKYDRLNRALSEAWRAEFGTEKPKKLAWHGFCRTTITTIAENFGNEVSADYTGRSVRVVETIYRRVRRSPKAAAAAMLDDIRREQHYRWKKAARSQ